MKRKYKQGRKLNAFEAFLTIYNGNFIYMNHKVYHTGWSRGWTMHTLILYASRGVLREAIKINNGEII